MKVSMNKVISAAFLSAALAVFGFGGASIAAEELSLDGVWEADNGESRYSLALCGDGTQLCALLTWIREDVQNERNRPYINQFVVDKARLAGTNPLKWKGKINIYGMKVDGSVTLVNDSRFVVKGCAFAFFCEETGANRVVKSASN